jgi:hypothetical protein
MYIYIHTRFVCIYIYIYIYIYVYIGIKGGDSKGSYATWRNIADDNALINFVLLSQYFLSNSPRHIHIYMCMYVCENIYFLGGFYT